mgnify:CR=1 FL=1
MEENVNSNVISSKPTGLLKEIIRETDCRDKVHKYLDSMEIPDRFFSCMFGELVKIFGTTLFEPNPYYYDSEEREKFAEDEAINNKLPYPKDYSYRDQIDTELTYEGGTGGWYNAFKTTCWILDMEWLLRAYEQLSWMNSDYFDEWVGDKIIEYLFEKDNYRERNYEIFLKGKGVI